MLSLAVFTKLCGHFVIGSDISPTEQTIRTCKEHHIPLFFSHESDNVEKCNIFVYTAAIGDDNPELIRARQINNIRIFTRSEYLALITDSFRVSVGISGTHGKSTVTNMLSDILLCYGCDVTMLAGAERNAKNTLCGGAMRIGKSDTVVYEACEYSRSFLDTHPGLAVILNVEREHTDVYPTLKSSEDAFFEFAKRSKICVLSRDCPACNEIEKRLKSTETRVLTFSLSDQSADVYARSLQKTHGRFVFDAVTHSVGVIEGIKLAVPGEHNVKNALASITAALALGMLSNESAKSALQGFCGIKRRFEYIGNVQGADVYDDYAHHPTEIKATLNAAKELGYDRILCAFQPHTYSRTYELFDGFVQSLSLCDEAVIADIFAAREKNVYGITGKDLADKLPNGKYIKSFDEIYSYLLASSHPKTLIITMGAGKMNLIAKRLVYGEENLK